MIDRNKILLISFLLICSVISCAQTDELLEVIKKNNSDIKSLSAKFSELQYKKSSQITDEMEGKIYYDAIGRLSIIYSDPKGDYVIIDGTYFITKRNGKRQHHSTAKPSFTTHLCNSLIMSMAGDIQSVADENEAEIKSKTDNQYYNFTLKRKNIDKKNKNDIISLNLRYDKKTYVLLYMNVVDGMGNTITYALQHPQLDVPIPESVFNSKR